MEGLLRAGGERLTSAMSIWTEEASLAVISLLVAEHFLGMYRSTIFPSSFCIFNESGFYLFNNNKVI
jgi:hypothetical protein